MNIKTKLVLATTAVVLLAAPASARFDGDEGGASAYPRFHSERAYSNGAASAYASGTVVRPRVTVQQPRHPRHSQSWW
jgi:hypothetical protein